MADIWIGRAAKPDPAALAAVAGRAPAVLVTGGSEGIGREIARQFFALGCSVVLVARSAEALVAAAADIRGGAAPGDGAGAITTIALDVTQDGVEGQLDDALGARGLYLDVLVNCAGTGLAGPFESHDARDIERLVALNVVAVSRLMRHVLPGMLARGRGGVLNVASLGGYVPGPYQAVYYASKAYVCSLTEAVAFEHWGCGVRIAVLAPGPVNTCFHDRMGAGQSLYRWLLPAVSAKRAARAAVFHYAIGRTVIVPGLIAKLLCWSAVLLPHVLTQPIVAALLEVRTPKTRRTS